MQLQIVSYNKIIVTQSARHLA